MCGLFGYELVVAPQDKDANALWYHTVQTMAEAMASRGTDSWGIAAVPTNNVMTHWRGLGSIAKVPVPAGMARLLGHTRYATTGGVTVANAHPFDMGSIIAAHNGVISNHKELETKDYRKYPVDSMALLQRIADKQDTKDVQGYGAVVWLSTEDNQLYFARLRNGDLEAAILIGPNDCFKATVVSSKLKDVKDWCTKYDIRFGEFPKLPEGRVYTVAKDGRLRKAKRPEIQIQASSYTDWRTSGGTSSRGYCSPSSMNWTGDTKIPCRKCGMHFNHQAVPWRGEQPCEWKGSVKEEQRVGYEPPAPKPVVTESDDQTAIVGKEISNDNNTMIVTQANGKKYVLTRCPVCAIFTANMKSHQKLCGGPRCPDCHKNIIHKGCKLDGHVVNMVN